MNILTQEQIDEICMKPATCERLWAIAKSHQMLQAENYKIVAELAHAQSVSTSRTNRAGLAELKVMQLLSVLRQVRKCDELGGLTKHMLDEEIKRHG